MEPSVLEAPRAGGVLVDPRVRAVPWRDLVPLGRGERVRELLLPLPWLLLAVFAAGRGLTLLALVGSFYFFLAGLRLVHDVFHRNLGLPPLANDLLLAALSVLMLGSMHAVRLTHLQHHRDCLGEDDVEGAVARQSGWGALVTGPLFPFRIHRAGVRLAMRRQAAWIYSELALNLVWIVGALAWGKPALRSHVVAMAAGQMLAGYFAVWTVHHHCDRWAQLARTLRNRLKSAAACNMFFHLEHHLFPRVPTCHLPALAERLDQAAPELSAKQVF